MNALTETPAAPAQASQPDMDVVYAGLMARAVGSPPGAVALADALLADIVSSGLPNTVFKSLAAEMGKATGLDASAFLKQMNRARGAAEGDAAPARPALAEDPEPCAAPKTLGELTDMISRLIRMRVDCAQEAADAVALWIVCTWGVHPEPGVEGPDIFPRLHINSPTKRCGKSLLLEIVQHCSRRPVAATDISEAAIYRLVDALRPTLVIDEADRLFAKNRDLVGIVNSGYARTGGVVRNVETRVKDVSTWKPQMFPTFAPVALAGIGNLPGTIEDRSVRVTLQRRGGGR